LNHVFSKEQDRPDFEAIFLKLDAEEKRIMKEKNIEDNYVKRKTSELPEYHFASENAPSNNGEYTTTPRKKAEETEKKILKTIM